MSSRVLNALLGAAPVRLWALIGAGPPLTAGAAALAWIIWRGDWPVALAARRLDILGFSLYGALGLIGVIVVSLASVKVRAQGVAGASLEIDGDEFGGRPPTA